MGLGREGGAVTLPTTGMGLLELSAALAGIYRNPDTLDDCDECSPRAQCPIHQQFQRAIPNAQAHPRLSSSDDTLCALPTRGAGLSFEGAP